MDFPGAITIGWDTFTRYCKDVGSSLARHGFRRMLFLNGHGSNQPFVDAAARLVGVDHSGVLAGSAFYLSGRKALERIEEIRDSDAGGMAHACELETSIYLAIDPDAVEMEKVLDERGSRRRATCTWSGRRSHAGDALVVGLLAHRHPG